MSTWLAGIDETGRIGNELTRQHDVTHGVVEFVALGGIGFGDRDMGNDAGNDIAPLFNSVAFSVLQRISLAYNPFGIQPERLNVTFESDIGRMNFVLQNLRHLRTARGTHLSLPFPYENRTRTDFGD